MMNNDMDYRTAPDGHDDALAGLGTPVPALPWHRFPGTIVYPTGNAALAIPFMMVCAALIVALALTHLANRPPGHLFDQLALLGAVICIGITVQIRRAAQASCVEMQADAIVRYTLSESTVLPYTDITGYTSTPVQSDQAIALLTRRGVGMRLFVTAAWMDDIQFRTWLGTIPRQDEVRSTRRTWIQWCLGCMTAGWALASSVRLAIHGGQDIAHARSAAHWPTIDGVVNASAALPGSRVCHPVLDIHYVYTVGQQQYAGSAYQFGDVCGNAARAIAAANPVGRHIAVHYQVRDHASASSTPAAHPPAPYSM